MRASGAALLATACLLAACSPSRPDDLPPAGSGGPVGPPVAAWRGRGRLRLARADRSWSGQVLVRGNRTRLAVVLLADGGIPLASLELRPEASPVTEGDDALVARLRPLAVVLRAAWLLPPPTRTEPAPPYLEAETEGLRRLYAGNPPLLRWLSGPDGTARLDDYRTLSSGRVPCRLHGRLAGVPFELALRSVAEVSARP